jgi:hypothetical protein
MQQGIDNILLNNADGDYSVFTLQNLHRHAFVGEL